MQTSEPQTTLILGIENICLELQNHSTLKEEPMKRKLTLFFTLLVSMVCVPCVALATFSVPVEDYTIVMTSFGGGFGDWEGVYQLNFGTGIQPNTYIKQDLNAANEIEDGLGFEESVYLQLDSYTGAPGELTEGLSDLIPNSYNLILAAQSLSGSVFNVEGSLGAGDAEWEYEFNLDDPDDSIGLYLMTDAEYQDLALNFDVTGYTGAGTPFTNELLEMSLTEVSAGVAPGFVGGDFVGQGTFGVSFKITDALAGIFTTNDGTDFDELAEKGWLGASQTGEPGLNTPEFFDGFFTVTGNTGDKFLVSQVPEPTTLLLFGTGLLGLAGLGRKKLFKKS